MAALHRYNTKYSGPGGGAGRPWPTHLGLDPILSSYMDIDPWRPGFTFDGLEYRLFVPPPAVAEVGRAYLASYRPDRSATLRLAGTNPNRDRDLPGDLLYAFEGATGGVKGKPPAWSLMGFVLARMHDDDGYDLHIVYRGSQSGWAYRAALWGIVSETGNADWVTDMEMLRLVDDPRISEHGRAVEGLRNAVVESVASLGTCLEHLATTCGAPRSIHVTGHSLGGALATQLAAGLTIGQMVSVLPEPAQSWPWRDLQLTTFGVPKALDDTAATAFDRQVAAGRVWLDGDPLVASPFYSHVGVDFELHLDGVSGGDAHRPENIRRALADGDGGYWLSFETFAEALEGAGVRGFELQHLFSADFGAHLDLLVQAGMTSVGDRSSYWFGFTKTDRELAGREQQLERVFAGTAASIDEVVSLMRDLVGVQPDSSLETHLQRLIAVRESLRNGWNISQLVECLDRAIPAEG